jgi:hypothetical protein
MCVYSSKTSKHFFEAACPIIAYTNSWNNRLGEVIGGIVLQLIRSLFHGTSLDKAVVQIMRAIHCFFDDLPSHLPMKMDQLTRLISFFPIRYHILEWSTVSGMRCMCIVISTMCLWKALLLSNFKILNLPNEFFGVNIDELAIERRKSVWFISLQPVS